jgi:hypothetical protein
MRLFTILLCSIAVFAAWGQTGEAPKPPAEEEAAANKPSTPKIRPDEMQLTPEQIAEMTGFQPGGEKVGVDANEDHSEAGDFSKTEYEILEKGAAADSRDALADQLKEYFVAASQGRIESMYQMQTEAYRAKVPYEDFAQRKQGRLLRVEIQKISLWGDGCARVHGKGRFETEMMTLDFFPVKQYWILENDEWRIYAQPRDMRMGFTPPNKEKAEKRPCVYPATVANKN